MPGGIRRDFSRSLWRLLVLPIPLAAVLAAIVYLRAARAQIRAEGSRRGDRGGFPEARALRPPRRDDEPGLSQRGCAVRAVSGAAGAVPRSNRHPDLRIRLAFGPA